MGIESHSQVLERKKSGKEASIAGNRSNMRTSRASFVGSKIRGKIETLRQEWCARGAAWNLAKDVYKLKKVPQDTFFSPAEASAMPAPSSEKPEEREFVIDSRASMHM